MPETGGSTTQSGIIVQNSVAALYLGRMCDGRQRPASQRVIRVRVEAPAAVDDTVVTFADNHSAFIQSKERVRQGSPEWNALWAAFDEQFHCGEFQRGLDRLTLHLGSHVGIADDLRGLCERASTSPNLEEWQRRMSSTQAALVDKIKALLKLCPNDVEVMAFFATVDVEVLPLTSIERDLVPNWMPPCNVTPLTLFQLLRDRVGGHARIKRAFDADSLIADLAQANDVRFDTANVAVQSLSNQMTATVSVSTTAVLTTIGLPGNLPSQEKYHEDLNFARTLVNDRKPSMALEYLRNFKERHWSDAQPAVRYRVLTYEACSNLMIGEETLGGRQYLEALQYSSLDDNALAFAALGHMLLGQDQEAGAHARRALEANPANARAYTILLHGLPKTTSFDDAVNSIPAAYRSLPEVAYSLGYLARDRDLLDAAEEWTRLAIEKEANPADRGEAYGLLGSILLQKATQGFTSPAFFQLTDQRLKLLEEGVSYLGKAWNSVVDPSFQKQRVVWIANRSLGHKLLGNTDEASIDLDEALRLDPNHPIYAQRKAIAEFEHGDRTQAIARLKAVIPCPEFPDVYFALAAMLVTSGQFGEANSLLVSLSKATSREQVIQEANRMQLASLLDADDLASAQEVFADLKLKYPEDPEISILGARLARLEDRRADAVSLLSRAADLAEENADERTFFHLAAEWYALQGYQQAAAAYARVADRETASDFTIELLKSYYFGGDLGRALDLAEGLLKRHGPLPVVSEIAAAIYEEVNDLKTARDRAKTYIESHPQDFKMRLRLARICMHLQDAAGVDEFLCEIPEVVQLSLEQILTIATLLAYRHRLVEALRLAYEGRRRYGSESKAHLFYVILATPFGPFRWPNLAPPYRGDVGYDFGFRRSKVRRNR